MPPTPILRLITWLPAGGIERKIVAVLSRLNPELFAPRLVCIREEGPLAEDLRNAGVPVDVIPFRSRLDPFALWKLRAYIRQFRIGLVHAHMYRASTPATVLSLLDRGQPPVIAHYHNIDTWESGRQAFVDGLLARRRINVAVSDAVRRNVQQRLSLPDERIQTLPNGVDVREFRPRNPPHRMAVRTKLGLPEKSVVLVQVGRLVAQKNHQLTLKSMVHWRKLLPGLQLLLLGDGPLREHLERMATDLSVADCVHFAGRVDNVSEVLPACDVAIMPSLKEGFSNALLEAMACGLPVVATDVGGNREAVVNGVSGLIVPMMPTVAGMEPEVNEQEWVRMVSELIQNRDRMATIGAAARARSEDFSIERMVADIEALYLEVLRKPSRPIPVPSPVLVPSA